MKRLLFAILSLSTVTIPTIARAAEWKTSFGAELEAEALYYPGGPFGADDQTVRGIFSAKLPSTVRYGRAFRFRALPYVQYDPWNASSREHLYLDAPEGYFQYQALPFTFQVGLNVFTWGDTDVFNPLDVVNPRRYYDPLRSEKVGTPAVVVKREFENFFVEGVYIPVQRRTYLPGENSRWLPRDVYRLRSLGTSEGAVRLNLPSNIAYSYVEPDQTGNALRNNFGGRIKFRLPGFDWTIAGFQGASITPEVGPKEIGIRSISVVGGVKTFDVYPDVALQATSYPIRMTGTSFTWDTLGFLVKGAVAYTHVLNRPDADRIANPELRKLGLPSRLWESVLAAERTFSVGSGSLTALAQATRVERGDNLDTNSISIARMFERAGMGALRWAPDEGTTVLASYLRDFKFKGSLWHIEGSYKIRDGWRAKVSGDILSGNTETPIGTYGANDRVTVSLAATF
ncbi:MAG: hypothetical protein EOP11_04765 [Proteobacteria bacterium]|nr:MAG: hypothetical protein EOP11_04765 [Pseudomonadota bacterium]